MFAADICEILCMGGTLDVQICQNSLVGTIDLIKQYIGVTFESFHIVPKVNHLDTILFKFKVLTRTMGFLLHVMELLSRLTM